MFELDVTDYMYDSYSFPVGAQKLIDFLVENIGKQDDYCQSAFSFTGVGWSLTGYMTKNGTRWKVNIEDDTLAVFFKLKWL